MEYKEFGIYVDDTNISVLAEVNEELILGIDYPLNKYYQSYEILSNERINNWLLWNWDNIGVEQIFDVDLYKHPDVFKDYGYLGHVNNETIKKNIKESVKNAWREIYF